VLPYIPTHTLYPDLGHPKICHVTHGKTLWATISVLCEERQRKVVAQLGGGFWEPSGREVGEDVEGNASEEDE
jgi:hypothetical protein